MKAFEENNIKDWSGAVLDPDRLAWCAGFFDLLLALAGLDTIGSLAAKDYQSIGTLIETPEPGDAAFWDNHIAVFAGTSNTEKKYTDLSAWADHNIVGGAFQMVLGGNQGDRVNISPKKWYDNYSTFRGYRRIV